VTACVLAGACVLFDRRTRTVGDAARGGPLCRDCLLVAERDVRGLVLDYRDLAQRLGRDGSTAMGTRVSGNSDPSSMLALDVDELQRDILWTLTVWEPAVREAARLPPEPVGAVRPGWAVAAAAAVIAPRVDVLAALPLTWGYADGFAEGPVLRSGVDAIVSMSVLRRRARSKLGLTRLVHALPGECSRCGMWALRRDDGSDTVRCEQCDQRWTTDDYLRYVGMILSTQAVR